MKKVLILDDDVEIHEIVSAYAKGSFEVSCFERIDRAMQELKESHFDLVILDIGLEDGDGIRFFAENKEFFAQRNCKILLLSGEKSLSKKLEAFHLGAVDYVVKPFEPLELIARVRANLSSEEQRQEWYVKKDIRFNLESGTVFLEEEGELNEVPLSPIEFKLMIFFAKNEGRAFTREQLLDKVWGETLHVSERTVDQHVSKLRKKIKSQFYEIRTSRALGYRFTALK
ncbi:MAG: hypothetical protein CME64_17265 [Halobacteriovoraceae bacterium]|nr:hypothetical protein [Halobacteriovoraceae bacterium]|tara:strand:+ start:279855 stop:280538 length:684 start_codon:yes stop_codon:yes gene_type:complete